MRRKTLVAVASVLVVLGAVAWATASPRHGGTTPAVRGSAPAGAAMQITISENLLATQIGAANPDSGLRSPTLDILPDNRARLTGTFSAVLFGLTLTLRPAFEMSLGVADGHVVVNIENVEVAGLQLPRSALEPEMAVLKLALEKQVNEAVERLTGATKLRLTGIRTTDDSLILFLDV